MSSRKAGNRCATYYIHVTSQSINTFFPGYYEKPGSCPPAKYPDDYHNDYYSREVNPYRDYDYYPNTGDRIYYPNFEDMPMKVYKVLKKRRRASKRIEFEDHQGKESDLENSKILDRIPDILTPFQSSRHFNNHNNQYVGGQQGTCRRDYDCAGNQKCCHVQVAKYRFRLGCRYPRMNHYFS